MNIHGVKSWRRGRDCSWAVMIGYECVHDWSWPWRTLFYIVLGWFDSSWRRVSSSWSGSRLQGGLRLRHGGRQGCTRHRTLFPHKQTRNATTPCLYFVLVVSVMIGHGCHNTAVMSWWSWPLRLGEPNQRQLPFEPKNAFETPNTHYLYKTHMMTGRLISFDLFIFISIVFADVARERDVIWLLTF